MFLISDSVKLRPGSHSWRMLSSRRDKVAEIDAIYLRNGIDVVDIVFGDAVVVRRVPSDDLVVSPPR